MPLVWHLLVGSTTALSPTVDVQVQLGSPIGSPSGMMVGAALEFLVSGAANAVAQIDTIYALKPHPPEPPGLRWPVIAAAFRRVLRRGSFQCHCLYQHCGHRWMRTTRIPTAPWSIAPGSRPRAGASPLPRRRLQSCRSSSQQLSTQPVLPIAQCRARRRVLRGVLPRW